MDILREVGGDAGILLWQSYRNVMLWASSEPEERGKMFSPEAGRKRLAELLEAQVPAQIVDSLVTVGRMIGSPGAGHGEAVAEACAAIGTWADREGAQATALAFRQAAALSAPMNAAFAYAVGKLARRRGEAPRAETWFRHAVMIGRQSGDWTSYSQAYISLGNMLRERGNLPAAQRMHVKALRAARRKGLRHVQGKALHELFIIATETGRNDQAEQYAKQAFKAYGPQHDLLPTLAHDVAYFWMDQGDFARVIPVFEALLPHFATPPLRMTVLSHIARAAGGTGQRDLFRKSWVEVTRMAKDPDTITVQAGALLELGQGAASLGEWDRAEQAAQQALRVAKERGEAKYRMGAEALLEHVQSGRSSQAAVASQRQPSSGAQAADWLAGEMVRSLEAAVAA
jgi:tetratricopeptide (TPR) repeat protein